MTRYEKVAYKNLTVQDKMAHSKSPEMRAHLSPLLADDPYICELTSDGLKLFVQKAADMQILLLRLA